MIPRRATGKIRQHKNHSGNFYFFQKGTLEKYYKDGDSAYLIDTEPFLSTLQEAIFSSGFKYFFMLAAFFHILKNYPPCKK